MNTDKTDWTRRARAAWQTWRDGAAPGTLGARLAACELDLREREAEIERLRREYGLQREQGERREAEAAAVGLEALARQLALLFSQLATMQALSEDGRAVRVEDVLKLFVKVEQVLAGAGLERIGRVGEETCFDSRVHQRMSGADVDDGDPVRVRFVGYRLGAVMVLKAMVSRLGGAAGGA